MRKPASFQMVKIKAFYVKVAERIMLELCWKNYDVRAALKPSRELESVTITGWEMAPVSHCFGVGVAEDIGPGLQLVDAGSASGETVDMWRKSPGVMSTDLLQFWHNSCRYIPWLPVSSDGYSVAGIQQSCMHALAAVWSTCFHERSWLRFTPRYLALSTA